MGERSWFHTFYRDGKECCAEYTDENDTPCVIQVWTEPKGVDLALSVDDREALEAQIAESEGFMERYDGDDFECWMAEKEADFR